MRNPIPRLVHAGGRHHDFGEPGIMPPRGRTPSRNHGEPGIVLRRSRGTPAGRRDTGAATRGDRTLATATSLLRTIPGSLTDPDSATAAHARTRRRERSTASAVGTPLIAQHPHGLPEKGALPGRPPLHVGWDAITITANQASCSGARAARPQGGATLELRFAAIEPWRPRRRFSARYLAR